MSEMQQDYIPGLEPEDDSQEKVTSETREIPSPDATFTFEQESTEYTEWEEPMTKEQADEYIGEIRDSKCLENYISKKTGMIDYIYIGERIFFYPETGKVKYTQKRNDPEDVLKDRVRSINANFDNWIYGIEKSDEDDDFNIKIIRPPLGMKSKKR